MPVVAAVDYVQKRIYLSVDTVNADLDTLDVYRECRERRRLNEGDRRFSPMIEAGGNIPKITGVSATPAYARLLGGARIVPYDSTHRLRVIRDTFTDDGFAGRDCFDRSGLTAGVEVDIDVDFPEIEIRFIASGSGLSTQQANDLTLIRRILQNKTITDPATGAMTVYSDDGSTPLLVAPIFKDAAGAAPYDGTTGVERREKLA
jgi:hypothetical protein